MGRGRAEGGLVRGGRSLREKGEERGRGVDRLLASWACEGPRLSSREGARGYFMHGRAGAIVSLLCLMTALLSLLFRVIFLFSSLFFSSSPSSTSSSLSSFVFVFFTFVSSSLSSLLCISFCSYHDNLLKK